MASQDLTPPPVPPEPSKVIPWWKYSEGMVFESLAEEVAAAMQYLRTHPVEGFSESGRPADTLMAD